MAKKSPTVEQYIAERTAPIRTVLEALRLLLKSTLPGSTEGMKWGAPIYGDPDGRPLVYLYGGKDHVNLGFLRGAELDDPDELLGGSGKSTRTLKIYPGDDIPQEAIRIFLNQCAEFK